MDLIAKTVKEKIPCYFISPHLDDAILSAGGLISYLSNKIPIEVLTVFTKASPRPYTRSAKNFMRVCGYEDANLFFQDRRKEDGEIFQTLGVKYRHLDFIDVGWRKKKKTYVIEKFLAAWIPEVVHLYPFHRNFRSGKIASEDEELIQNIANKLKKIIPVRDNLILCPLGIGKHVDHIIVRDACIRTYTNLFFWTDYPYVMWENSSESFIKNNNLKPFRFEMMIEKKKDLILKYKTQPFLYKDSSLKILPEIYYYR